MSFNGSYKSINSTYKLNKTPTKTQKTNVFITVFHKIRLTFFREISRITYPLQDTCTKDKSYSDLFSIIEQ